MAIVENKESVEIASKWGRKFNADLAAVIEASKVGPIELHRLGDDIHVMVMDEDAHHLLLTNMSVVWELDRLGLIERTGKNEWHNLEDN